MITIELELGIALKMLEVLRLDPIYTLLNSEFDIEKELGLEDFKPHKWIGYEKDHAEQAFECYSALFAAMMKHYADNADKDLPR